MRPDPAPAAARSTTLRVALVNPSFSAGAFTHQLANALVDAGAAVDVWTSPHFELISRPWFPARYRPLIRYYRWTQHRSWQTGWSRPFWRAARLLGHLVTTAHLLLVAHRYDVVHVYFLAVLGFDPLWFPLLRKRTRVAYHVHNLYPHDEPRTERLRRHWSRVYCSSDLLFVHTDETRRGLIEQFGVPEHRITMVQLGEVADLVRPEAVAPVEGLDAARAPLILMLGDVRENKGVDLLIRAAAMLKERGAAFQVIVAGRHPNGRPVQYEQLASDLGVGDRVSFRHHFVPEAEIPTYLRSAAVVAFPYRGVDSQSAGAVWAISLGRPIVATRTGGLPDLVEGGGCGILVPPDDAAALADAIEQLLREPALAESMGRAGAAYARTALAWEGIAERALAAYRATGSGAA